MRPEVTLKKCHMATLTLTGKNKVDISYRNRTLILSQSQSPWMGMIHSDVSWDLHIAEFEQWFSLTAQNNATFVKGLLKSEILYSVHK